MTPREKKIRDELLKQGLRLKYGYSIVSRKNVVASKKKGIKKSISKSAYSHYLEDDNGKKIKFFESFNRDAVKKAIISYLNRNKRCELYLYKVELKGYDSLINAYKNHPKTSEPCVIVAKGNKEYLKPIK